MAQMKVRVKFEFEGAEQAKEATDKLSKTLKDSETSAKGAGKETDNLTEAQKKAKQASQQMNGALRAVGFAAASQAAGVLSQKLGNTPGGAAFGALQSVASFAAMGAAAGPMGAAVGAAAGGAFALTSALMDMNRAAASAATELRNLTQISNQAFDSRNARHQNELLGEQRNLRNSLLEAGRSEADVQQALAQLQERQLGTERQRMQAAEDRERRAMTRAQQLESSSREGVFSGPQFSDAQRAAAQAELQSAQREAQAARGSVGSLEGSLGSTQDAVLAARRAERQAAQQAEEAAGRQGAQAAAQRLQQAQQLLAVQQANRDAFVASLEPQERLDALRQVQLTETQRLAELEEEGRTSLTAKIALEQQRQQVLRRNAEVQSLALEITNEQREAQQQIDDAAKEQQEQMAEALRMRADLQQQITDGQWGLVEAGRENLTQSELELSLVGEREYLERQISELRADGVETQEDSLRILQLQGRQMQINSRLQLETERRAEAVSKEFASGGQALGQAFAGAYEQAIKGEKNFGEAFKDGMKTILMQLGTKYIVEGAAALFEGVGNAVMNAPHAGAKFAEGAGKLALGLSLGGIGAAISPSSSAAEKPANPVGQSGSDSEKGAGTMVINFNSPVVTAGTKQQLGRELNNTIMQGTNRYGS